MLYIVVRDLDANGKLLKEDRVSGNIPEAEFQHARYCMEYLFNLELQQNKRLFLKGGSIQCSERKCLMILPKRQYEVEILTA